jgi:hypothetical protein
VKLALPGVVKVCVLEPTVSVSVATTPVLSDIVMVSPAFRVTLKIRVKGGERAESTNWTSLQPLAVIAGEGAPPMKAADTTPAAAIAVAPD